MREPHYLDEHATVYAGDCLDVLRELPDCSVDAVVTDPPYGLGNTTGPLVAETVTAWLGGDREFIPEGRGFMGKPWDAFVPPVAVWDECLRVLKPGGHALVFSGARTLDLMTLGLRLAGFDIRDSIMWAYGSGFPKNKDVSEAMGNYLAGVGPVVSGPPAEVYTVTRFLRAARDAAGWTNRQLDEHFGTNGMAGHWTSQKSQPAVPSLRQWDELRGLLGFDDKDVRALVEQLGSTERPEDWGKAEGSPFLAGVNNPAADKGVAWGTALKPAHEPIVVARKPVIGSITSNVNVYGTGALNIGGCRTGEGGDKWPLNVLLDEWQAAELDKSSNEKPAELFPTFRYEPKAATHERPRVNGVTHPTVKPLDLMRWLCRLVTPPGGVVLEPFAGSGTTVEAAVLERFRVIGVERETAYLPLIESRLTKPLEQVMDFGALL